MSILKNDPRITTYLLKKVVDACVAPRAVAGNARRTAAGWQYLGGATWDGGLAAPFDLASITKSLVASLCAELVGQGRLRWDTSLQELLPDAEDRAGNFTIESLLSHRSGLDAHREFFQGSWQGEAIVIKEVLASARRATRSAGPTGAVYSDLGYILVGIALEQRFNTPLDHLLNSELFEARGLKIGSARAWRAACPHFSSFAVATELQPSRGGVLRGVVHDDNSWCLSGTACSGHAGLFSPLEPLLRFGAQCLDAAQGRTGPIAQARFLPLIVNRSGGTLKMGFDGVSQPGSLAGSKAGPDTFGHLGFTGTSLWCDPDRDMVTVLLSNRVSPTRENPRLSPIRGEIHDFLWSC